MSDIRFTRLVLLIILSGMILYAAVHYYPLALKYFFVYSVGAVLLLFTKIGLFPLYLYIVMLSLLIFLLKVLKKHRNSPAKTGE